MKIQNAQIDGVRIIEPKVHYDERGFFMETFRAEKMAAAGIASKFVQDNHSCSSKGTLRGLHFQKYCNQGKLVRVLLGEVYDVVVDLRVESSSFGKWLGIWLSAENKRILWVPKGCAHGFYVTSQKAELVYKCTDYYAPEHECSLIWNDRQLDIKWPLMDGRQPTLSQKDQNGLPFNILGYFRNNQFVEHLT